MTRVLVTGGAGYVGSHACKALATAGHEPVVYDSLVTGHAAAVQWGPLEVGDIQDVVRLDEVIGRYSPEALMHFAASAYVGESMADPMKYYKNNVAGSLTLFDRSIAAGVRQVVFSSSCAIYGAAGAIPITEETPQRPINPYGHSKQMVETILEDLCRVSGMRAVALRYFNAAGASPDGDVGEDHDPETHIIPLVLMAARDPRRRFTIFGTNYDTPDGTCVRDFIHVTDLAAAHVKALDRLADGSLSGFHGINLGTGRGFSVREIVAEAQRLTNLVVPLEEAPRRPGDPAILVADVSCADSALNWSPENSDIETIIRSAWNWMQADGYRTPKKPEIQRCNPKATL